MKKIFTLHNSNNKKNTNDTFKKQFNNNTENFNIFDNVCNKNQRLKYKILRFKDDYKFIYLQKCLFNNYRCSICNYNIQNNFYLNNENMYCYQHYSNIVKHYCLTCNEKIQGPMIVFYK